jgi:hypothetical protein
MESIDLDKDKVNGFIESEVIPEGPEPEETGAGPGDPAGTISESEAIQQLNKTLTNISKTAHNIAVENGFKGLGDIPPQDFAELAGVCIKRNFSSVIVEKSPEVAFGSICALIIVQNLSGKRADNLKNEGAENGS